MAEVDLDRLAAAYDHRPDSGASERVGAAVGVAHPGPGDLVLDVGGGRGAHAAEMAATTGCSVVVVDPSQAMTRAAVARGLPAVVGRGEDLAFRDRCAALVYFHLSIHHGAWRRMLAEAWRVVRPGGMVFVWTMAPEYHRTSFLATWFPRVGEIDAGRFPPIDRLVEEMSSLGGAPRTSTREEVVSRTAAGYEEAVRAGFVSTLHLLDDREIEEGLTRFRSAHPDPAGRIEYTLRFSGVWSIRPPVES